MTNSEKVFHETGLDQAVKKLREIADDLAQYGERQPAELRGIADALVWITQVVELRVGNVCDPNYSVVAAVERSALEEAPA